MQYTMISRCRSVLAALLVAAPIVVPAGVLAAEEPPAPAAASEVEALIARLGDPDYDVRQHAQAELAKLGFAAFDALSAAQHSEDLEIASRAKYLLRLMQVHLTDKNDPPEVIACLADFRLAPLDEQLARLARLARLPEGKGTAALCRLARFEESEVLSKHAAVAIIRCYSCEAPPSKEQANVLRGAMATSRRTAADWLRTLARFHDAPREALTEWTAHTRREQEALARGDGRTDPQIVEALAEEQLGWTCKLSDDPAVVAEAVRAVVSARREWAAFLTPQVDWMVQNKLWRALGLEPVAFAKRLVYHPWATLYAAAQALEAAGQTALAEAAATRALGLEMGDLNTRLVVHFQMALALQREGLFKWSEREYRRVIELSRARGPLRNEAYSYLAQMLHDQADDLRAAKALAELVELLKKEKSSASSKQAMAEIVSQMKFLYASHFAAQGDRVKERAYLEEALAADPTNVDVLIACYRLPDPTPEFRKKLLGHIAHVVDQTREEIRRMPTQAAPRNQLAWLVANTEGNLDEALRMARESLELEPETAAYLDTLAHCYYAKGDFASAVKHQAEALRREPHSGQIAKQLGVFRAAYQKKHGKPAPEPTAEKTPRRSTLLVDPADEESPQPDWQQYEFEAPFD